MSIPRAKIWAAWRSMIPMATRTLHSIITPRIGLSHCAILAYTPTLRLWVLCLLLAWFFRWVPRVLVIFIRLVYAVFSQAFVSLHCWLPMTDPSESLSLSFGSWVRHPRGFLERRTLPVEISVVEWKQN
jgi:hypothetical protein